MKIKTLSIALLAVAATACSPKVSIELTNSLPFERKAEIASLPVQELRSKLGNGSFVVKNERGREVTYQLTHDSLLVFPASIGAKSKIKYTIAPGTPAKADTLATGAFYPIRKDDVAWENDRMAYRAYGPELQASGERAFGYDIWTKSVTRPVVLERYYQTFAGINNFHHDIGTGMDVYTVGPTLGGGTAARIDSTGNIVYPWCFSSFKILDNGPLRFTVQLDYPTGESRLVSLDAGEFLNKAVVNIPSQPSDKGVTAGVVVHKQNPQGYAVDKDNKFVAVADLTDNPNTDNGVIYVGIVAPEADALGYESLPQPAGDAIGHVLATRNGNAATPYTYYWGSGWSKGFMPTWQAWQDYLAAFSQRLKAPINVKILN